MKNRKLLLIVSLVLALTMSLGGTLAYLTDSDADVNTMVLGSVKIMQHEYQRVGEDGAYETYTFDKNGAQVTGYKLEAFEQDKPLLPVIYNPGTSTAEGYGYDDTRVYMDQVESYGNMQVFETPNAVDKFVTVENTGVSPAYVRTFVAFENGTGNASLIGFSHRSNDAEEIAAGGTDPWIRNPLGQYVINGNTYNVFEFVYRGAELSDGSWRHANGKLPGGDTTYPSLCQVYIKSTANNADLEAIDGNKNGKLDIIVLSQAVQADGFANATTALEAGFGTATADSTEVAGKKNVQVWLEAASTTLPKVANTVEALKAQLATNETDIVVNGVQISEDPFKGYSTSNRNFVFNDCTFTADLSWKYFNNATYTNCTFDCGSDKVAVHYDKLYGDAVYNNCHFKSGQVKIGTNEEGDATVAFNDCVFDATESTSIWAEKGMRIYSPVEFNDCAFNNRVVVAGSNGLPVSFNSCTMTNDAGKTIPVYYNDNTDGIIRGGNVPAVTIR